MTYSQRAVQLNVVTTNLSFESHLADGNVTITSGSEGKTIGDTSAEALLIKDISVVSSL